MLSPLVAKYFCVVEGLLIPAPLHGQHSNLGGNVNKPIIRSLKGLACGLALTGLLVPGAANAQETAAGPTADQVSEQAGESNTVVKVHDTEEALRSLYERFDVPVQQQDALVQKILAGEDVLSGTPGSKPVTTEKNTQGNVQQVVRRFADGSLSVSEVERPPDLKSSGAIQPLGVGSCEKWASGSGYRVGYECLAHAYNDYLTVSFRMDYQLVQGHYDKILRIYNGYKLTYGGTATGPKLKLNKASENSSGRAYATATGIWTAKNQGQSKTYKMTAYVGRDSATTTLKFGG